MYRMSTKTHGLLDYLTGAAPMIVPPLLDCTRRTRLLPQTAGAGAVVYSAITKYERGVIKLMPMKAHLALDAINGGTLVAAACLMDDEDPAIRTALAGIGLFEIAAAAMTEPAAVADDAPDRRRTSREESSMPQARGVEQRIVQEAVPLSN